MLNANNKIPLTTYLLLLTSKTGHPINLKMEFHCKCIWIQTRTCDMPSMKTINKIVQATLNMASHMEIKMVCVQF